MASVPEGRKGNGETPVGGSDLLVGTYWPDRCLELMKVRPQALTPTSTLILTLTLRQLLTLMIDPYYHANPHAANPNPGKRPLTRGDGTGTDSTGA